MISIVSFKGNIVKSDTTSNYTILNSGGNDILLSFFVNFSQFLIVYRDSHNGFRSSARYLT